MSGNEFPYLKRLTYGLILFAAVIVAGTAGFHFIAGNSLFDGFYNTLITVSTLEACDFGGNTGAKVFTVFLILIGVGNLLFLVSTFAAFFADGEFRRIMRRRKMDNIIKTLTEHIIVCGGADDIGRYVIGELEKTGRKYVVVNSGSTAVQDQNSKNVLCIEGDPSDDEILSAANIGKAAGIISILPEDKDNVFVTLTARGLNPDIRIVAKCVDVKTGGKLKKAGADSVVNTDLIGGMRIASELMRPAAVSFLDEMIRVQSKSPIRFEDVKISTGSEFVGMTLKEAALSSRFNLLVVGARTKGETDFVYSPPSDYIIEEKTELVVLGDMDKICEVRKIAE